MKYIIKESTINVTIPITSNEYLNKFILDNSFMRNDIRNDFVEEANKYKGEWNKYKDFKPLHYKTYYYNNIEEPLRRYNYYCVGLSEQVAKDFKSAIKAIRTTNNKKIDNAIKNNIPLSTIKLSEFHYKKFDYNRYSFKVKLKPSISNKNKVCTRLNIIDSTHIEFKVRSNKYNRPKEIIPITLKEPIYDSILDNNTYTKEYTSNGYTNECTFRLEDIKEISFIYKCGCYYIQLSINVLYCINKNSIPNKYNICGIDTGIHHPIAIYDNNRMIYSKMDDKVSCKIHYLERRIRRLNKVYSNKYTYNKEHDISTSSNNIIKIIRKIRRLYRKISNIKKYHIQCICKKICTRYSSICVDSFTQPNHISDKEFKDLPNIVKRKINYTNRFHKMYYFNTYLKYTCIKYGCNYIEAPDNTTRTCSICGYINKHIPLSQRDLICSNCNNVIERDMNAAKNCYDYLVSNM